MSAIFSVEGNIGSGKSTLVKLLKDILPASFSDAKFIFLQEPVSIWKTVTDENGTDVIEKFYANKSEYAFSFQMMAYISRLSQLRNVCKKNPNSIIITERSVFTDRNVFAKMLYNDKLIKEIDYKIYNMWFDEFIKEVPLSGLIYLNTEPEKCKERIIKRNRNGEEDISIDYLANCKKYHDIWVNSSEKTPLIIDGNSDFLELPETLNEIIEKVLDYIKTEWKTNFAVKSPLDGDIDMLKSIHIC